MPINDFINVDGTVNWNNVASLQAMLVPNVFHNPTNHIYTTTNAFQLPIAPNRVYSSLPSIIKKAGSNQYLGIFWSHDATDPANFLFYSVDLINWTYAGRIPAPSTAPYVKFTSPFYDVNGDLVVVSIGTNATSSYWNTLNKIVYAKCSNGSDPTNITNWVAGSILYDNSAVGNLNEIGGCWFNGQYRLYARDVASSNLYEFFGTSLTGTFIKSITPVLVHGTGWEISGIGAGNPLINNGTMYLPIVDNGLGVTPYGGIGFATSDNGDVFTRSVGNPLLVGASNGWSSGYVECVSVIDTGTQIRIYTSGEGAPSSIYYYYTY